MVDKTLSYLDYTKLLELFKNFSSIQYVHELISNLCPLDNKSEILERQDKIEALIEVLRWDGNIPFSNIPAAIKDILKRLHIKDSLLEAGEFVAISSFLSACDDISRFLKKVYIKKPFIEQAIQTIKPLHPLFSKISKTINSEGFIEDTASYELSRIRSDLFVYKERIRKQLEKMMERESVTPILQDVYIAMRNGRYVIPLKPNFNQFIQGIVHDYSHSLKTSFVEPVECVELNNNVNILEEEEEEEETRILKELTEYIGKSVSDLEVNLEVLCELDFYQSLGLFSTKFECVRPEISIDEPIDIRDARNPFIIISKKDQTIPVDIHMDKEKNAMIISGPNAGGKTAALKTVGLLSLMAQTGLFIPASGRPRLPVFSKILAIIGDEQDISMELSSFTAHMMTIKDMYNKTKGGELILIDEIGGNTEQQEASALSMGIIDTFVEKGCKVIVTTHLNLLKAYGYTKPFAINASTAFDPESMKPLYKLSYGIAGYSNAINVARNIDIPGEIIERSYGYMGTQELMLNNLISALESGKQKVDEERKELNRLREEFKQRLSLLKQKKDEYIKKVDERCNSRLLELETELEEVKKEIAKKEKASIKISRERLSGLRDKYVKEEIKKQDDIKIGDYVKIRTLGSSGYVADIDEERDICEIVTGNVRTKINRVFVSKAIKGPEQVIHNKIELNVERINEPELNLIGMRVEEAIVRLDKFIDTAIIQGVPRARILHGIGTGRLMKAVKEHLSDAKYVRQVKGDEKNMGVTIVEFL
ncbi:MAG: Smr/MutS family protein [Proteobacteria bacterium]|nr:Smr/MutS family protein [Pseudomonadota bacterium]